jgi:hypothetical protein
MCTIPNLIYADVNHNNKETPKEIFNLDDFWKIGEHRAYRFKPVDDGFFHCLIAINDEFYGFKFKPERSSVLEFECLNHEEGKSVTLSIFRRRLNGVLMPRVRGFAK